MLRKLARRVFFLFAGLAVLGGILYAFGLRMVQYGGGRFGLAFTKTVDQRAVEIEKHREAQRAEATLPAPAQPAPRAAAPRADPKGHQEITRFTAIEGKTWNHPAMSDGILVRNIEEMAAFSLRKQAEPR